MTDDDLRDSDIERQLRESLRRHAERITPRERRTEILAMVHEQTETSEPRRRWLIPVAAAASVALIGAIAWGVANTGNQQVTPAATSTSSTTGPTTSNATGVTTQVALPAYFVGANSGTGETFGLYREFVRTAVPAGATPAQKAKAAVAVAMNAQPFTNFEPYIQPWSGTKVEDLTLMPDLITITLSGPGASSFTPEQTKLAVQELVWTAQAAIGQGTIPVKFVVADGSPELFGTYATNKTYNRPTKEQQYEDLAPIWILSPERGKVFPAGAPVVANGESCAFEATTQWELKKGGVIVKSGSTMASSGCPIRGTWQVNLGVLAPGSYTFRMFEVSMKDGQSLVAETSKPFTVK
ncbi:MAG TPA: Gmad2 immunoglobulin-like domain-containing protein [Dermatophilaceae bacterium]|nr:Gmad2 immunoglobulin-like domain-containing protein [Dermatophilaceae bacterium]